MVPPSPSLKNGLKKISTRMVPLGTAPAAILAAALYSPRDLSVQTRERNKKLFSSKGMNEPSKDDVTEDPDYRMSIDDNDSESDLSDEESDSEEEQEGMFTKLLYCFEVAPIILTKRFRHTFDLRCLILQTFRSRRHFVRLYVYRKQEIRTVQRSPTDLRARRSRQTNMHAIDAFVGSKAANLCMGIKRFMTGKVLAVRSV